VTKLDARFYDQNREPIRRSLGCHFEGAALPVPDLNYAPDQVAGMTKRVAAKMPKINRVKLRKFKRFVKRWCKKNLQEHIFKNDEQFDFYEWIESTPYPLYRKEELTRVYELSLYNPPNFNVKAFIKDEPYPEYKHVRGIYSRHDDYKVRVGPFFRKLGDIIFNMKWFIKRIPVNQRPQAMMDKFGDISNLFCTDFSQYEATFVEQLMKMELIVYRYLLQNNPNMNKIITLITKGMMSKNRIQFHKWTCNLYCKRMSGEMSTSVSNGFMNLLITHFLLEEAGNKHFDSYIEGDDSINSFDVRAPTAKEYEELGGKIKIEFPNDLSEASFCGQIFDKNDLDNVANPIEALVSFGWTNRQYMNANDKTLKMLLKSKALSMLYEYSGCPILRSLALYALRMTNDIKITNLDSFYKKQKLCTYDREFWLELIDNYDDNRQFNNTVKENTRKLVERKFGISVEMQFLVEKYLDEKTDLSPINIPELIPFCHSHWIDYYLNYGTYATSFKTNELIPSINITTSYKTILYMNKGWTLTI